MATRMAALAMNMVARGTRPRVARGRSDHASNCVTLRDLVAGRKPAIFVSADQQDRHEPGDDAVDRERRQGAGLEVAHAGSAPTARR